MGVVINGKTAEDIKARQEACVTHASCKVCPYEPDEKCDVFEVLENARARIEHLESERDAALAKVPKWISVKDRLPESYDEKADCFLVTDGEFIWMAYYACKEWQFAQCTNSPYVIDWTEITHWMPLPELLKEEEK